MPSLQIIKFVCDKSYDTYDHFYFVSKTGSHVQQRHVKSTDLDSNNSYYTHTNGSQPHKTTWIFTFVKAVVAIISMSMVTFAIDNGIWTYMSYQEKQFYYSHGFEFINMGVNMIYQWLILTLFYFVFINKAAPFKNSFKTIIVISFIVNIVIFGPILILLSIPHFTDEPRFNNDKIALFEPLCKYFDGIAQSDFGFHCDAWISYCFFYFACVYQQVSLLFMIILNCLYNVVDYNCIINILRCNWICCICCICCGKHNSLSKKKWKNKRSFTPIRRRRLISGAEQQLMIEKSVNCQNCQNCENCKIIKNEEIIATMLVMKDNINGVCIEKNERELGVEMNSSMNATINGTKIDTTTTAMQKEIDVDIVDIDPTQDRCNCINMRLLCSWDFWILIIFVIAWSIYILLIYFCAITSYMNNTTYYFYGLLSITSTFKIILKLIGIQIDIIRIKTINIEDRLTITVDYNASYEYRDPINKKYYNYISFDLLMELVINIIYFNSYYIVFISQLYDLATDAKLFLQVTILHVLSELCQSIIRFSKFYFDISTNIFQFFSNLLGKKHWIIYYSTDESTFEEWRTRHSIDMTIRIFAMIISYSSVMLEICSLSKSSFPQAFGATTNERKEILLYLNISFIIDVVYFTLVFIFNNYCQPKHLRYNVWKPFLLFFGRSYKVVLTLFIVANGFCVFSNFF